MSYILSTPTLSESANLLGERLGLNVITKTEGRILPPPLIRWGNSSGRFGNDTRYNDPLAIYVCGNKLRFSRFCIDNGISALEYNYGIPERYPVVVRTLLQASNGSGIVVCENDAEFDNYKTFPWSYFYNFQFELGVHILGGEVSRVFKKLRQKDLEEEKYPIKNSTRGYKFSLRSPEFIEESYRTLDLFVANFYNVLAINMVRLDIGWDADVGIFRIIEANSAPGLSANKNTLEVYVEFLKRQLGIL